MSGELSDEVRGLIQDIGEAGLAKMAESVGLAAEVDQHAAAVRDVISASGGTPDQATLLDYLDGFSTAAVERGWWPGDAYDWELVRVIAVCWMMRQAEATA